MIRGEFDYAVRNVSREDQDFDINFYIENELGDEAPPFDEKGYYKAVIDGVPMSKEELNEADNQADDTSEFTNFQKTVTLEPNQTIRVRLGFYLRKRTTDSEIWQTLDLCTSLEATVKYDPSEFELHITPVHPASEFTHCDKDQYGAKVELNEPLLKNNGVFLWWAPREEVGEEPRLLESAAQAVENVQ